MTTKLAVADAGGVFQAIGGGTVTKAPKNSVTLKDLSRATAANVEVTKVAWKLYSRFLILDP